MKSSARWLRGLPLLALFTAFPDHAFATGGWVPERFLDEGGQSLKGAPQFYWDIEVTRLAKQYAEKDLPKLKADVPEDPEQDSGSASTAKADHDDFEAALKSGKLKPANADAARAAHAEMRTWLDLDGPDEERPKLTEADSEFADYHKGAAMVADDKPAEAKAAWEKLLRRPAEERHYRTVWAAYMLGKVCLEDAKTRADAIAWFVKCRQYAREGFADSLNLAADSYGWQARAEYDSGDRPASARHYLQQLALGDTSAVASLKLLVPDRELVDGLGVLSFATLSEPAGEDPNAPAAPDDPQVEAKVKAAREAALTALAAAAKDEVLRQLVTAHILAAGSSYTYQDGHARAARWLDTINKLKLDRVEGAASLGWAAYEAGRFDEAAKLLALDKPASSLGQWLQAKLALRKGDFAGASGLMTGVVPQLPEDAATRYESFSYLPKASASADLGASLLAQGKFQEALSAFWSGGCWADAAYVAERLLTTDELVAFVKANATLPDDARGKDDEEETPARLHHRMKDKLMNLAGRRLIREDRNAEGRALLDPEARGLFDQFRELGAVGKDEKKPKKERAKALFDAACILEDGSSWCGTEDDVVRANWGGYAPEHPDVIVQSRLTGKSKLVGDDGDEDKAKLVANFVPSSEAERKRLQSPAGQQRMKQYVRQASALAVKAAGLLPDNTEETADVLNQAGRWIQDLDNPGADKIYFQIEKRCPKTEIGKAVIAKHWFIEPDGPWTGSSQESNEQLPAKKDDP
ncbi:hypothetical protein [Luteolibacter sp. LG18]|uniref:hypothetical protein n=1 Tax=Luteolibacter sp. LG18 TaxID=2819286 RepID=UPI002B316225|nr:hypothetical protein llg_15950 [Luteolibacter sp. LG18]